MKQLILGITVFLMAASCNQSKSNQCIHNRITNFGTEICASGATAKRYTVQGNTTYAIHPGNYLADGADEILNAHFEVVGIVGGIAGITDVNGENYYDNARLEETLWQN
ncbi:hypothetical protein OAL15_04085 [Flavobacteriales bacterium]|nr:hypothetical protein [Flavobacteriales bacterium]